MWYYMDGNERRGPVSEEEMSRLAGAGLVRDDTLVWSEGMSEWLPAGQAAPQLFAPLPPAGSIGDPVAAPPPPASAAYAGSGTVAADPRLDELPNMLPWSIAVTLLCCVIGGVIAILYSVRANTAKQNGNYDEAFAATKSAKLWCWLSVGVGLVITVLVVLVELGNL